MLIDDMTPEGYAGLWGCDPCYDKPPRLPGDGYLLYNFGSCAQEKDVQYLTQLLGAVNRTLEAVTNQRDYDPDDKHDLRQLRVYVTQLLKEAQDAEVRPAGSGSHSGAIVNSI